RSARYVDQSDLHGLSIRFSSWATLLVNRSGSTERTDGYAVRASDSLHSHQCDLIVALPGKAWMYPDMSRFQGLFGHPNVMGGFCMLSYPVLLWKYHRSQDIQKWIVVAFTVMVLFLHLLTGSRGSLLPAALMIVIWLVALRQCGRAIALTAVLVLLAVAATLVFNSRFERDENTGLSGLTGRPEFWQASYE